MRNTGKLESIELRVLRVCEALLFCPKMKRPMREHEPFNCKILSQTGELHCLYVEYSTAADCRQVKRVKSAKGMQIKAYSIIVPVL